MISIAAKTCLIARAQGLHHVGVLARKAVSAGLSRVAARVVVSGAMLIVMTISGVFGAADRLHAAEQLPLADTTPEIVDVASIRMPQDFSRVEFYLITVDVGSNVWDNFGHTALRVVDNESNSDLVFNWGLFDTSVGNVTFASNFLRGILNYQLGVSPPAWELGRYEREQRTVWQDRINLTNAQKATLYQRLAWNLREENIVYSYQYFFDNCTTRVRDYLNEALDGRLEEQNRALSPRTFRDEVKDHYASVPFVSVSLDILMNGRIDRRMSHWEEMFLPLRLRQELTASQSDVLRNGQRVPLLDDSRILMEFLPPSEKVNGYYVLGIFLFLPVLILFFNLKKIPLASFSSQTGFTFRSPGLSYRLLGLLALAVSIASGIYGLIMTVGWFESGHLDLHHNLNLLLFWPTDLLGIFFALRWLIVGRGCAMNKTSYSLIVFYLLCHLLATIAYILIAVIGLAEQNVSSLLIFVVPALTGFTLLVWNAGFSAIRRISFS